MSELKHTPGPWVIIPPVPHEDEDGNLDGGFSVPASIEGGDGNPVCMFGDCAGSGTLYENEADYHLIAAAPKLLKALWDSTDELDGLSNMFSDNESLVRVIGGYVKRNRAVIAKAIGKS